MIVRPHAPTDASAALAHDASTNALIAHYRARKTQP